MIELPAALAIGMVGSAVISWLFVSLVRATARREVNRALKGYIVGHVLQPRNKRGQFEGR